MKKIDFCLFFEVKINFVLFFFFKNSFLFLNLIDSCGDQISDDYRRQVDEQRRANHYAQTNAHLCPSFRSNAPFLKIEKFKNHEKSSKTQKIKKVAQKTQKISKNQKKAQKLRKLKNSKNLPRIE